MVRAARMYPSHGLAGSRRIWRMFCSCSTTVTGAEAVGQTTGGGGAVAVAGTAAAGAAGCCHSTAMLESTASATSASATTSIGSTSTGSPCADSPTVGASSPRAAATAVSTSPESRPSRTMSISMISGVGRPSSRSQRRTEAVERSTAAASWPIDRCRSSRASRMISPKVLEGIDRQDI